MVAKEVFLLPQAPAIGSFVNRGYCHIRRTSFSYDNEDEVETSQQSRGVFCVSCLNKNMRMKWNNLARSILIGAPLILLIPLIYKVIVGRDRLKLAKTPQNTDEYSHNTRGKYLKPKREDAYALIKRMIVYEGYSEQEVKDRLKIPARTFERYLHDAFAAERQALMVSVSTEDILTHVAVMENRLSKDRRDLIAAIKDPSIDPKRLAAMIEGYWLSSEMTVGIFKLHQELLPKIFDERRHISIEELLQVDTGNGKTKYLSDLEREKEA
jgi:hypothetical protein